MKFILGLKLGMAQVVDETLFHLSPLPLLIKRRALGTVGL